MKYKKNTSLPICNSTLRKIKYKYIVGLSTNIKFFHSYREIIFASSLLAILYHIRESICIKLLMLLRI
jgi:hypothetical protein